MPKSVQGHSYLNVLLPDELFEKLKRLKGTKSWKGYFQGFSDEMRVLLEKSKFYQEKCEHLEREMMELKKRYEGK